MEGMVEEEGEVSAMDDDEDAAAAAAAGERRLMVTLDDLKNKMADFARERDWDQFHSPRNLLLALVGEVGELSEIFQWRGEVPKGLPGWREEEREHLGEELSDVLLYLVRLSDVCGVDLGRAVLRKLELNALKYPAEQCKGSSKKHTHYSNSTAAPAASASARANSIEESQNGFSEKL
ncbi:dCTP pyrophosphatase 1-like [Ananas comosus]|uniref:dCTP pyrophosphatase 1 n=1 Tax=Ananas comosus TaxID=4615 RepID=A0A199UNW7_ANACO|nr:dCTP pyrophosphatase 1-like [Ananas comosus]OAY66449.1 dCTP pyrophosphatase 1 [Ananas comosus]